MPIGLKSVLTQGSDLYFLFSFLKRLTTPFEKTKAYQLGIIDKNGKNLIKKRDFETQEQKDAYTMMDTLIFNLKKLLGKVPGGKSRIASYAAALLLLREEKNLSLLKEEVLEEEFMILYEDMCCEWQLDMNDPDSTFLTEEAIDENIVNKVMDLHKNINAKKAKHMIATAQSMGLDPVKIQMYLSAILPTMTTLAANYEPEDEVIEDAPANSMGGGAIAGSAEAGDDPPVRKKKKKGDPMQILARSGIKEHLRVFPSQNIL